MQTMLMGEVALGFDNQSSGFIERFAIKRTGAMAVARSTGTLGQVLTANGSGAAPQWKRWYQMPFFNNSILLVPPTNITTAPITIAKNAVLTIFRA